MVPGLSRTLSLVTAAAVLSGCGASLHAGSTSSTPVGTPPPLSALATVAGAPPIPPTPSATPAPIALPTATAGRPHRSVAAAASPSACADSEIAQHLRTDRARYERGQTVHVDEAITNISAHPCYPLSPYQQCVTAVGDPRSQMCAGVHIDDVSPAVWGSGETRLGQFPEWDQVIMGPDGHPRPAPPGDYTITARWESFPWLSTVITVVGPAATPTPSPTPASVLPLP